MVSIIIKSKGGIDYVIYPRQITHMHESTKENGTWIILSCGTKIITEMKFLDLRETIENILL